MGSKLSCKRAIMSGQQMQLLNKLKLIESLLKSCQIKRVNKLSNYKRKGKRLLWLETELMMHQLLQWQISEWQLVQELILRLKQPILRLCVRSEEHTSELQSRFDLVCRL